MVTPGKPIFFWSIVLKQTSATLCQSVKLEVENAASGCHKARTVKR